MKERPFGFEIDIAGAAIPARDRCMQRRLSALRGQYQDTAGFDHMVEQGDPLIYEVHEVLRPESSGELLSGLSIVHPGRVGDEYFMTKGHYHSVRGTAEIYYCLKGHGLLLMENEDGDWTAEEFRPGRAVYVTPNYAHRSVNLSLDEDLVTFFVYPGHAGHDYATIESNGFRKRVVHRDGTFELIDNPAWSAPAQVSA